LDCAENHTSIQAFEQSSWIQAFEQSSWIQAFEQSSWLDEVLSFRSQVLTTICLKNAAPTCYSVVAKLATDRSRLRRLKGQGPKMRVFL
jgi:hypothetical protein